MPVTEDDVAWCYRHILGRLPESPAAVAQKVASIDDFRSLVLSFIRSTEFHKTRAPGPPRVPLSASDMEIECAASPAGLALLTAHIRSEWTHLGEVQPHYSVLTNQEFLPGHMDRSTVDRFYATGHGEASTIRAMLRRLGVADLASKTCVEYGCGLGRVTLALARDFREVHAYDISSSHVGLARQRAATEGIGNIVFHLCTAGSGIEVLEKCDFFYSKIVFQHNPPPLMRELIGAALASLAPGGIGIFQVPTYMLGYRFSLEEYLGRERAPEVEMHCLPQRVIFSLIEAHDCQILEVREDDSISRPGEWISNVFAVRRK